MHQVGRDIHCKNVRTAVLPPSPQVKEGSCLFFRGEVPTKDNIPQPSPRPARGNQTESCLAASTPDTTANRLESGRWDRLSLGSTRPSWRETRERTLRQNLSAASTIGRHVLHFHHIVAQSILGRRLCPQQVYIPLAGPKSS